MILVLKKAWRPGDEVWVIVMPSSLLRARQEQLLDLGPWVMWSASKPVQPAVLNGNQGEETMRVTDKNHLALGWGDGSGGQLVTNSEINPQSPHCGRREQTSATVLWTSTVAHACPSSWVYKMNKWKEKRNMASIRFCMLLSRLNLI